MLLAIVLNLVCAVVLVGGWAAAVWALYKGLGEQPAPAARPSAHRLQETARLREAELPDERAA